MFLVATELPRLRPPILRGAEVGKGHGVNNFGKNLALWIVIGLLLVALFNLFQTSSNRGPQSTLAFSDFVTDVNRAVR